MTIKSSQPETLADSTRQKTETISLPERLKPYALGVCLATKFPTFNEAIDDLNSIDAVRARISLRTIMGLKKAGCQIVIVDGGSSPDFLRQLENLNINVIKDPANTFSGQKRLALQEASKLPAVEVLLLMEPEKLGLVADENGNWNQTFIDMWESFLDSKTKIGIPTRDQASWDSYPEYQVKTEQKANQFAWDMLVDAGILPDDTPLLDLFFGPRLLANKPEVVSLFQKIYHLQVPAELANGDKIDPEMWMNTLQIPVVNALLSGLKVSEFLIRMLYPPEQRELEDGNVVFEQKRHMQALGQTILLFYFLQSLQSGEEYLQLVEKP